MLMGVAMVVTVSLLVVAIVIFGGFYRWARQRGMDQDAPTAGDERGRRHISLLTEAVAYIGAILLLAGAIAAISQQWEGIGDWGHVGLLAGAAAFFLLIGIVMHRLSEPAIQRLVGVVWVLSAFCGGGATGFATHDVYQASTAVTVLAVGITASAYSAVLWLFRRQALQNAALFAGLIIAICGTILTATGGPEPTPSIAFALPLWAFGLGWTWLGWQRLAGPAWVTIAAGVTLALFAPSLAVGDYGWMYAIGVVTAGAAMAGSVPLRNTPLLAVGTLAMFGYVTSLVVQYFHESLGVPGALTITGALILGLAAVSTRLLRAARPRPPEGPARKPGEEEPPSHDLPRAA